MPTYAVGARWWCPRCWRRGPSPTCASCRVPARELSGGWSAATAPAAGAPWPAAAAFTKGRGLLSPLTGFGLRRLRLVAAAFAGFSSLGPLFAPLRGGGPWWAELGIHLLVAVVSFPVVWAFFVLFLHLYGLVAALLAALLSLVPRLPLLDLHIRLPQWIFAWIARQLLCPSQMGEVTAPTTPLRRGTLSRPAMVHVCADPFGLAARMDAWVDGALYLGTDGGPAELRLDAGALRLPAAPTGPDAGLPPAWLDVPHRPGARAAGELPVGTVLTWAELPDGALWVEVGSGA